MCAGRTPRAHRFCPTFCLGLSRYGKKRMPREENIPFLSVIQEIFGPVFADYGFALREETLWNGAGEYVVSAQKGEIALNFYLGTSQLFYYCDVGLELSGKLGAKATADSKYRRIGVSVIARCLDPNYKPSRKMPQTKDEVKLAFEKCKQDLLNYCEGVLSGDVSIWPAVVRCLKARKD